jgi:hypothetical protein
MQQKFGSFKEKDCLVSLNGMELRTLEFDEAMRMINQSNVFRFLRVRREVYAPAFLSTQGSANSEISPLEAHAPQGRRHLPDPSSPIHKNPLRGSGLFGLDREPIFPSCLVYFTLLIQCEGADISQTVAIGNTQRLGSNTEDGGHTIGVDSYQGGKHGNGRRSFTAKKIRSTQNTIFSFTLVCYNFFSFMSMLICSHPTRFLYKNKSPFAFCLWCKSRLCDR